MSSDPESSAPADAASAVVTRLLDATFARDFDASRTLLDDDAEFHLPGGRKFRGVDAVIEGFKATLAPG